MIKYNKVIIIFKIKINNKLLNKMKIFKLVKNNKKN